LKYTVGFGLTVTAHVWRLGEEADLDGFFLGSGLSRIKNYLKNPEDKKLILGAKSFQFGNEIGRFSECRTPKHFSIKISNPINPHHLKISFS
jgi:hypothetical protein